MKRIVTLVLATGTALVLGATAAQAQLSVGIGGGATIPIGDFGDAAKTGWHGLANLGYNLPSGLGLRGDFYYGQHGVDGAPSGVDAKWKLTGGLGNVTYGFGTAYVIGTVGFMNAKVSVSGGGFSGSGSETKLAFGGGAGVKFKAGSRSSVFLEGRYITVNTSGSNANFIPITLGVSFGMGK